MTSPMLNQHIASVDTFEVAEHERVALGRSASERGRPLGIKLHSAFSDVGVVS